MEYLKDLNEEQLHAVTAINHKILVLAGAGSGKTKVLTTRIKYLIDNGVNPNEIVAFTFTKKAADEMGDRLKFYHFNNVFTFHSFCFRYIMDWPEYFGFQRPPSVVDDYYKTDVINKILKGMNVNRNPSQFLKYISNRKNGLDVTMENQEETALFNTIYYKFQEYLSIHNVIDFDDMISLFVNNFDNYPDKTSILNQCKYILVDECQDTNQIQLDLVLKLSSLHQNIFMVGDEDQLIYSFRSSDIEIINKFKSKADEIIVLNKNYRSSEKILEYSNRLIKNNTRRTDKVLFSDIKSEYNVKIRNFESTLEESKVVARMIKNLIDKGYSPSDIAVLYRNNYQANLMELALTNEKIPYKAYGKLQFYEYLECRRIISAYRFLTDMNDPILFIEIPNIDSNEKDKFIRKFSKYNFNILDYAKNYDNEVIKNTAKALIKLKAEKYKFNKQDLFENMIEVLYNNNFNSREKERLEALKNLITSSDLQDECEIFNDIMLNDTSNKYSDKVNLLTIHKSKGLEFKCVFVISVNEGILPKSDLTRDKLEEERRLMYVAMTRAKEYLWISEAEKHYINGIYKRLRPSVFMSEIN